ncbi:MAG: hypothetical protein EBU79_11295 [Betaproteobacteria bacterium]|nr:hypothetical protein [Betaproteobacteria bacterium]
MAYAPRQAPGSPGLSLRWRRIVLIQAFRHASSLSACVKPFGMRQAFWHASSLSACGRGMRGALWQLESV